MNTYKMEVICKNAVIDIIKRKYIELVDIQDVHIISSSSTDVTYNCIIKVNHVLNKGNINDYDLGDHIYVVNYNALKNKKTITINSYAQEFSNIQWAFTEFDTIPKVQPKTEPQYEQLRLF